MDAIIVDKSDGSQHRQSVLNLQLDEASVVKLPIAPESVVSFEQSGDDLVIVTVAGETIVIGDFFVDFDDERNELVLVDDDGIAWWGQYSGPWNDFAFAEIGANSVSPFPFGALGGLGAASAGGLAFSGGSGEEAAASVAEFPVLNVEAVADNPAAGHVTVSGHSSGDYVVISYPDENGETVVSDPIPVNEDGSWSHDIPRDKVSEGDVDFVGTVTDPQGNPVHDGNGNPISDTETATLDLTAPEVGVEITDNGQDGTLVLTFSPDTDRDSFDPSTDLELRNADLGTDGAWSEDADGNQVWTVTITPTGNGDVTATVTDGSYTDTAGNEGSEGSNSESFDVEAPSVVVDIVNNGQTGDVTFTFSEAVTGFEAGDVSVGNGTLSGLTQTGPNTWTATVTPEATGDVTVSVGDGSYTDLAGNEGTKGSDTEAFDRTAPTVGVEITDNGPDGTLVLTFSPDTDRDSFDPADDLDLKNADLGTDGAWSEDADGNQVWTVTITPTGNGEVTATVTDGSYTDTAGNEGSEGSDSESFDVDGPSVVVDIVNNGQTGDVTFTFSEAVTGFEAGDVTVGNGTLSNLTKVNDTTWTATVTPEATGDVTVSVGDGSYTDLAGNAGTPGSDTEAFDRTAPTVGVEITDNGPDGTLVLTFSPDTDRDSFDPADDLDLKNADLGTDGAWSEDADGNQVWTVTITPTGNGEVTATVTDGSYTDTAGNEGSEGSDSESFDVDGPSVVVDIVNNGQTGDVTFTFSEAVTGFEAGDVSVGNGTLSNLTKVNDTTWTATVTPEATGDVTVSVGDGSYTDLAGNAGTPGSDTEAFDRTAPTVGVEITDNGQDGTLVLTFSPDTDRDSFNPADDLDLDNADLGTDGAWSEDADGNQVWTVTITPTGNGEVTATVTDGSYTDTAGNEGSEGSDSESFDVDGPSVVVDIVNNGQTGTVTFTFSEAVTGFEAGDVSVGNGTLSNLTRVNDTTWTATVTPEATGDVSVEVADGSYTDLAGNAGTPGSDTEAFDRTAPTVGVEITDNGQDGTLVLTFSPDTDRDSFNPADDLDLDNADLGTDGAWSEDADGNQVWTVTITPTGNGEVTATVTDGSYTDTAGNEGSEGSDSESFDVDGPSVVVDIDIDDDGLGSDVTFTFSEDVDGFDASDISVNNGTLSNLQQVDGHTWTARVTPEKAGGDVTVTVADESYTDKVGNLGSEGADTEGFAGNAPLANDDHASLTLAGDGFKSDENFNIAFVLDFSGSVNNAEAQTMLNAVKAAGQAFFEGTTGDVQIQLIAFSSDARSTVAFSNYAEFAAQLDAWSAHRPYNAGTDYTAAVETTMESYTPLDDYDNRVFFVSDGDPTEQTQRHWVNGHWEVDHSLTSAASAAWNAFVADNDIDVQAVGVGDGIKIPRLQNVDEADGDNHVIEVGNFDDLIDSLLDVIKEVDVSGNILRGDDGLAGTADDDLLGIDGGRILSIEVDGVVYTYDLAGITDSNGNPVANGSILNVETDQGGRLVFDFETGDWTYTADGDTVTGKEIFDYVLTDDSGDTSSASLTINVGDAPTATISLDAETLVAGEDYTVTVTFDNEIDHASFTIDDLTATLADGSSAGTLSGLTYDAGSDSWTATFTPDEGAVGQTVSLAIASGSFTDANGNGGTGDITEADVNTPPTISAEAHQEGRYDEADMPDVTDQNWETEWDTHWDGIWLNQSGDGLNFSDDQGAMSLSLKDGIMPSLESGDILKLDMGWNNGHQDYQTGRSSSLTLSYTTSAAGSSAPAADVFMTVTTPDTTTATDWSSSVIGTPAQSATVTLADGVQVSLDGGATWLTGSFAWDTWREHVDGSGDVYDADTFLIKLPDSMLEDGATLRADVITGINGSWGAADDFTLTAVDVLQHHADGGAGDSVVYNPEGGAGESDVVSIFDSVSVTDADADGIRSATVTLENARVGDQIWLDSHESTDGSIDLDGDGQADVSYQISSNSGSISLELSAADNAELTADQWNELLSSVQFGSTSQETGERSVSVVVNDGFEDSDPATATIDVESAADAADLPDLSGMTTFAGMTSFGLAGLDDLEAENDNAPDPVEDETQVHADDLIYDDSVEDLNSYLPEEDRSASAGSAPEPIDAAPAHVELDDIEDHAMLVG